MSDQIRVNGNQVSWGSITCKVGGDLFTGFTGITFSDKRERVLAYGMGQHHAPRGRSRGKYTPEPVKITGWRSSIAALRAQLALLSLNQLSYGDVEFDVTCQYFELADGPPLIVIAEHCVWTSNNAPDEESPDPLKEEIECLPMFIRRNGMTLFDSTSGL
jgi:hypothetical protein